MTSRRATWEVAAVGIVFLVLLGLGFRQVWTEAAVYREALLGRRTMEFHGKLQVVVSDFRREEDGFFQAMTASGPSPEHAQTWEGLDRLLQRTFLCAGDGVMVWPEGAGPLTLNADIGKLATIESAGRALAEGMGAEAALRELETVADSPKQAPTVYRANYYLALAARREQRWADAARAYARAAEADVTRSRMSFGCLFEAAQLQEQIGDTNEAVRLYKRILTLTPPALTYALDPDPVGYYWEEADRRLAALLPDQPARPFCPREANPHWRDVNDQAQFLLELREWIVSRIHDSRAVGSSWTVLVDPAGRSVVRARRLTAGATSPMLGYKINLSYVVQRLQAALADAARVEILLPSGTVLATSANRTVGESATHGAECRMPLDGFLGGFVCRVSLHGSGVERPVRRHVIGLVAMLVAMTLLAALALVALWIGLARQAELTRLKTEFISNVSHELKTPLALLRLIGETLALDRVKDPEKKAHYYELIAQETQRLTALVDNVLDFSRIDQGRKTYRLQPVDPRRIVGSILETYRIHLEKNGFDVRFAATDDLPAVRLDPDAYALVLVNLLDNAEKFSDARREVVVTLRVEDGRLLTEVADRGIGIPAKDRARIAERFFRSREAVERQIRGTGIGLSLVRHVAEAHGGTLTFCEQDGGGTVFTFAVPID